MKPILTRIGINLWWSGFGKGQALSVFITLVIYFIILYFSSSEITAVFITFYIASIAYAVVIAAIFFGGGNFAIITDVFVIFAAFTIIAFITDASALVFTTHTTINVILAIISFILIASLADTDSETSPQVILLSYVMELALVLVPILFII